MRVRLTTPLDPDKVQLEETDKTFIVLIDDDQLGLIKIRMPKQDDPKVEVFYEKSKNPDEKRSEE